MEGFHQSVNFLKGVIERQRGSHSAIDAEVVNNGLGAVVACTNGYAHLIEYHAGIIRMNSVEQERDDGCLFRCISVNG